MTQNRLVRPLTPTGFYYVCIAANYTDASDEGQLIPTTGDMEPNIGVVAPLSKLCPGIHARVLSGAAVASWFRQPRRPRMLRRIMKGTVVLLVVACLRHSRCCPASSTSA